MYLLGYDIGSSSVKASLVDIATGLAVASSFFPKQEAPIKSLESGWAEQNPEDWWSYLTEVTKDINVSQYKGQIAAVGISYQMHGLVCIDKDKQLLRDAIIWCDSRAVPYGKEAEQTLGTVFCMDHMLNAPGNFTAAKLAWVKENEPDLFAKIWKVMLPGDYIAMRLTGEVNTTIGGLSEGVFWDFKENTPAKELMKFYHIPESLLPDIVPTFGIQGRISKEAAELLGIDEGVPVCYRAGDQPNNALSLNVLEPGEIASTAGTSGVVYGVIGDVTSDMLSRVNLFAHVNHKVTNPRLGVLLCINGTGILNSWLHHQVAPDLSYAQMNDEAAQAPIGSDGLVILPFGNGAERMLGNKETGCSIRGLEFNVHKRAHVLRAAQEGIVFSMMYGIEIMQQMGLKIKTIHAGKANMFLSPIFRETLAGVSGATIELYETDGSVGSAKGAGLGVGVYKTAKEAFATLKKVATFEPKNEEVYHKAYEHWKQQLILTTKTNN